MSCGLCEEILGFYEHVLTHNKEYVILKHEHTKTSKKPALALLTTARKQEEK